MEQVLLGTDVRETKLAEGSGRVGQVNLTPEAYAMVKDDFDFEPGDDDYMLIVDNFTEDELGDYELSAFNARRLPSALIMDRSKEGLTQAVEDILVKVEPLASYLPMPILSFLVENASRGVLPPAFSRAAVIFVNLMGLSETIDEVDGDTVSDVVERFSGVFALINAAVEARAACSSTSPIIFLARIC